MLCPQGRRDHRDVDASAMAAMPALDQRLAARELLVEAHRTLHGDPVHEAGVGARERRAGRSDGDDRARADLANTLRMGVAVDRLVGAQDRVSTTQQGDARRDAEAQSLERRQPRLGAPKFGRGRDRVGDLAGLVPDVAAAAAHRLDEAVARMGVAVDKAGHHHLVAGIDDRRCRVGCGHLRRGADRDDPVSRDGDGAVLDHAPLAVECHDDPVDDENIGHVASPVFGSVRPQSGSPRTRSSVGTSDSKCRV